MNPIKRLFSALMRRAAFAISLLFPIDRKKIVVSSYYGRGYGDNPKYIVSKLLDVSDCLTIIWLIKDESEKESLPLGVKSCRINSLKCFYHLATAKVWIDNCRKTFLLKRKKQLYVQTWHGFALKRIEKDVENKLKPSYLRMAKHDSLYIDLIISDSAFMTGIYQNSFWYKGKIAEWGAPRNDFLISNNIEISEHVYRYFQLNKTVKIVMYAPTFRADGGVDTYTIDYIRLKKACEKRFGGEFVVFVRLHPNILEKSKDIPFDNIQIFNASYYPDMQELLASTDVLVSDYSSLMFDYALTEKPCFQFAVDIEAYKGDRNFYFSLDRLPFDLSVDNNELEKNILNFNLEKYLNKLNTFWSSVGMIRSGKSSNRCAEYILQYLKSGNKEINL